MSKVLVDKAKIAVIGGGIAGSTIALYLSELGLEVSLFEQGPSLVNGPPICHLHAGGNLYREISDEQCLTLLRESIDLVRFYPDAVDYRPTVIAVPKEDSGRPEDLYARLEKLKSEYSSLIKQDRANQVLGDSSEYFKVYTQEAIELLREKDALDFPSTMDEWMIPVAKNVDLQKIQFPLLMVQEYGLNLFRLASSVSLSLEEKENCQLLLNHKVTDIREESKSKKWQINYTYNEEDKEQSFDFLINAAGFRTGNIDDMLGFKKDRLVEFKAAYVSQWDNCHDIWPEVVFYGERGTPNGMAQFTPYPDGHFQLHGMTKSITLFEEGLVKSSKQSAQPQLSRNFLDKIDRHWSLDDATVRTKLAIEHVAQFIPSFKNAKVVSKPLFGAQQIPGSDASLRTADVSFEGDYYARCEIVKASSVLSMADMITQQLITLGLVDKDLYGTRDFSTLKDLDEDDINSYARTLCMARDYPLSLTQRVTATLN